MFRTINQPLSNIKIKALKLEKLFDLEGYVPHNFESKMVSEKRFVINWYFEFVKFNQIDKSTFTLLKNVACFGH